jgi:hypothetical protein
VTQAISDVESERRFRNPTSPPYEEFEQLDGRHRSRGDPLPGQEIRCGNQPAPHDARERRRSQLNKPARMPAPMLSSAAQVKRLKAQASGCSGTAHARPIRLNRTARPMICLHFARQPHLQAFCDAGGGTRTPDTRIMIARVFGSYGPESLGIARPLDTPLDTFAARVATGRREWRCA